MGKKTGEKTSKGKKTGETTVKKTGKKTGRGSADLLWDPETFVGIDVAKNEQKAVLYLGFDSVGALRTYQCSHPYMRA